MLKLLLKTILICSVSLVSAQSELENKFRISAGYGVGILEIDKDNMHHYYGQPENFKNTGPFYFKFAYGLYHNLSMGVNAAYAIYNYKSVYFDYLTNIPQEFNYEYESYSILIRMNYYFNDIDNKKRFDPYAGAGIGYRSLELKENNPQFIYYEEYGPNLGFDFTVGANVFIIPHLAIYIEAGIAKSAFQFGITSSF